MSGFLTTRDATFQYVCQKGSCPIQAGHLPQALSPTMRCFPSGPVDEWCYEQS